MDEHSFSTNTRVLVSMNKQSLRFSASPAVLKQNFSTNRKKRKNARKITIFFSSFIFFGITLILFFLRDHLPKPNLKSHLISPETENNRSLVFRKEIEDNKIYFESLSFATTSATLILKLDNDSFSYLDLEKDPVTQVKILSELLNRIEIQNAEKNLDYIDLRFERAVVKFK